MFNADTFKEMFATEDDWKAFFRMMFDYHIERLNSHEAFENHMGELDVVFRRMADARYEAEGEAWKAWRKSADYNRYVLELEQADESIRQYNSWLARRYTDRKLIHSDDDRFEKTVPTSYGTKKQVNDDFCEVQMA